MQILLSEELAENICRTFFAYTSLYWFRDALLCDGFSARFKKLAIYSHYPALIAKHAIKQLNNAAENYTVSIQSKSLSYLFYDANYVRPVMDVTYPELTFALGKEGTVYKANLFGLKITLSESVSGLKSLFSVPFKFC